MVIMTSLGAILLLWPLLKKESGLAATSTAEESSSAAGNKDCKKYIFSSRLGVVAFGVGSAHNERLGLFSLSLWRISRPQKLMQAKPGLITVNALRERHLEGYFSPIRHSVRHGEVAMANGIGARRCWC